MRLAILRVHKDEQSYNRHWMSTERLDYTGVELICKRDWEGQIVHRARNEVGEAALSNPDWDTAFMMDDDMIFPPDTIVRANAVMTAHPEIDILTGVYFHKRFPHTPHLYEEALEPSYLHKYWPVIDFRERADNEGLLEVEGAGAGIMFVRRYVFEKVKKPWFVFNARVGEDFYFCKKARTAGFRVFADVNMQAVHMAVIEVNEGIFQQVRPILKRVLPAIDDKVIGEVEFTI
mgnify:FL=1